MGYAGSLPCFVVSFFVLGRDGFVAVSGTVSFLDLYCGSFSACFCFLGYDRSVL